MYRSISKVFLKSLLLVNASAHNNDFSINFRSHHLKTHLGKTKKASQSAECPSCKKLTPKANFGRHLKLCLIQQEELKHGALVVSVPVMVSQPYQTCDTEAPTVEQHQENEVVGHQDVQTGVKSVGTRVEHVPLPTTSHVTGLSKNPTVTVPIAPADLPASQRAIPATLSVGLGPAPNVAHEVIVNKDIAAPYEVSFPGAVPDNREVHEAPNIYHATYNTYSAKKIITSDHTVSNEAAVGLQNSAEFVKNLSR